MTDQSAEAQLLAERARGRVVANMFGWCSDPDCGADIYGGEPHDPACGLALRAEHAALNAEYQERAKALRPEDRRALRAEYVERWNEIKRAAHAR